MFMVFYWDWGQRKKIGESDSLLVICCWGWREIIKESITKVCMFMVFYWDWGQRNKIGESDSLLVIGC